MTLRIVVADDEPLAIKRLTTLLAAMEGIEVVGTAPNGTELLAAVERTRPDLVLLDIQMPGQTGLSAAAALPVAARPEIVFVTAHEGFAPDAFDLDATDYLLKPVRFERLRVAVDRARRRRERDNQVDLLQAENSALRATGATESAFDAELWVPVRDGQVRVAVADILWIEAAKDYAMIHTALRSYILRTTMAQLAERLDPQVLVRIHRSAIVRASAITALRRAGRGYEALLDEVAVPIGVSYLVDVERRLGLSTN